jgi:cell wall-associated NlpC family hydrolase
MHSLNCRKTIVFIFCILFALLNPISIYAEPTSLQQNKDEVTTVKQQLQSIDSKLETTVEKYNQANLELDRTRKQIKETKEDHKKTSIKLSHQQRLLNNRVVCIYKSVDTGFSSVLIGTKNFNHFLTCLSYMIDISNQDLALLEDVVRAREELEQTELRLQNQEEQQNSLLQNLRKKQSSIEGQITERTSYLNTVENNVREMIREEDQQQATVLAQAIREQQREEPRQNAPQNTPQNQPATQPNPVNQPGNNQKQKPQESQPTPSPPKSAPHSQVVGIAMQHLGKPYQWGGSGPDSFDCSGLVMYCYAQIGISLPHSAAAQYNRGSRLSRDQLAPGDLVFFGNTGVTHVGIYAGGGSYIHAPKTGDVIKVSALSSRKDYYGACRP